MCLTNVMAQRERVLFTVVSATTGTILTCCRIFDGTLSTKNTCAWVRSCSSLARCSDCTLALIIRMTDLSDNSDCFSVELPSSKCFSCNSFSCFAYSLVHSAVLC